MSIDTDVPLSACKVRKRFQLIFFSFVQSRGNLTLRQYYKNKLRDACTTFKVTWEQACDWFRETVRAIEREEKAILVVHYRQKYRFLFADGQLTLD